jgi:hypothetical protein
LGYSRRASAVRLASHLAARGPTPPGGVGRHGLHPGRRCPLGPFRLPGHCDESIPCVRVPVQSSTSQGDADRLRLSNHPARPPDAASVALHLPTSTEGSWWPKSGNGARGLRLPVRPVRRDAGQLQAPGHLRETSGFFTRLAPARRTSDPPYRLALVGGTHRAPSGGRASDRPDGLDLLEGQEGVHEVRARARPWDRVPDRLEGKLERSLVIASDPRTMIPVQGSC